MATKLQFRRGLAAALPSLSEGEPGFTTDGKDFYIGSASGNIQFLKKSTFDSHKSRHAAGGADELTLADIGAMAASNPVIIGQSGKQYKIVSGVLRATAGMWAVISGGGHANINIDSVSQDTTKIDVTYSFTGTNIVGSWCCPDEQYIYNGYNFGASVGTNVMSIYTSRNARTIGGYVNYNGSSWSVVNEAGTGNASAAFSSSILTITHDSIANVIGSVNCRDGVYLAALGSMAATTTQVKFFDYAGTQISSPNTSMKVYWSRSETIRTQVDPATLDLASSNIWIGVILEI
jgi:hypothetical protein